MKFLPPTIPYLILAILLTFYSPEKVVAMTSRCFKEKQKNSSTREENSDQARHHNFSNNGEEEQLTTSSTANSSMELILVESQNKAAIAQDNAAVILEFQQQIDESLQEMRDQLVAAEQSSRTSPYKGRQARCFFKQSILLSYLQAN